MNGLGNRPDGLKLCLAICTYNNAPLLDRTLKAIESLEWNPGEIQVLVIDNNCTDNTAQVVDSMIQRGKIPGLRRIVETQQGLTPARRRAVQEAGCDLIGFIDDDCILDPKWGTNAIAFAESHPKAGAFGGIVEMFWDAPPTEDAIRQKKGYAWQNHGQNPIRLAEKGPVHLVGAGMVVRREPILASGWMDKSLLSDRKGKSLSSGGDTELILRIRHEGFELWYTPDLRLEHIIPANRMQVDYLCRMYNGFGKSSGVIRSLERESPPTIPWRMSILWTDITFFARRYFAYVVHDFLLRKSIGGFRKIQVAEARGLLSASCSYLFNKEWYPSDRPKVTAAAGYAQEKK